MMKLNHLLAAAALSVWAIPASAQATPAPRPDQANQGQADQPSRSLQPAHQEPHITPAQAKDLFSSVSQILTFASHDTDLPIRHEVKRRLITRPEVEKYVVDQFHHQKDTKTLQREEVVLKKFGLLDGDFHLQPFLVSLLTEQVAGFYDDKTKTVNLLDWVAPDEQKPIIAHELTHALQDQHTGLEKWEPSLPDGTSKNVVEDNQRIASDERETARDSVLEGQAMAVFLDYTLKPTGKSVLTIPNQVADLDTNDESPVMARAPRLLQESLLFPYRDGLRFEQVLLKDKGPQYAFAGVLDHPPSSSYEIMNPSAYERGEKAPLLRMPDVHGLLDAGYRPFDIGVMGELDVHVLAGTFGGDDEAAALTPQWDGGIYYAVQSRDANPKEPASTASIRLLYLSAWRTEEAAVEFAGLYGREIGMKYSGVARDTAAETTPDEQIYRTSEGPVLIVRQGRQVFVSESFDLDMARKLQFLFFGAQQNDTSQAALDLQLPNFGPSSTPNFDPDSGSGFDSGFDPAAHLAGMISGYGFMKAALLP